MTLNRRVTFLARSALLLLAAVTLTACGGGDNTIVNPPGGTGPGTPGAGPTPAAAALTVSASVPQIPSDGSATVTIVALAVDQNNNVVTGVPVNFSASSGALVVNSSTTDENGAATATLSIGADGTNRVITVTATSAELTATTTVDVVGGTVPVSTINAIQLSTDQARIPTDGSVTATVTALVLGAGNNVVPGVPVSFETDSGVLAVLNGVTDNQGRARASVGLGTDTTPRTITLTASVGAITSEISLTVVEGSVETEVADLLVNVNPESVLAGSNESVLVSVVAVDQSNNAVPNVPISFGASGGILTSIDSATDDGGRAQAVFLPEGVAAGPVQIIVGGAGLERTATIEILPFEAVAAVTLRSSRTSVAADDSTSAVLTAQVLDANNRGVPGITVTFAADSGSLVVTQEVTDSSGRATAALSAGVNGAERTISVTATAGGRSATTTIDVLDAPLQVAEIEISSSIALLPSDGSQTATITALALDADNNTVAGVPISFVASSGALVVNNATTDSNGVATATLSVGGDTSNRTITVTASAASLSANVVVEVAGNSVPVSSITLVASSNLLPSVGNTPVTLTAFVRDANNNVVEGVPVTFSADSGLLQVLEPLTGATGSAVAELGTGGDPTNRPITVQASTSALADTVTINVSGTTLAVEGPDNVILNDVVPFTARLLNSAGSGLGGRIVEISSAQGNTLSATTLVTNTQGEVRFDVTGTQGGDDTVSVAALGLTAQAPLAVSAEDSLLFLEPEGGAELPLNIAHPITVEGSAGAGSTVNFSTTRGQLSALSATLDGAGQATVSIIAATAGPATLTARIGADGPETQRTVEFIATTPATIVVQASRFTVGPGEQSTIVATVRDAAGNPVKNKLVQFQIEDVTGGSLSVGTATTSSAGTAATVYTGGETISGSGDVIITAIVQENPALTETVGLTVARREVDISIGTGNELFEPNSATYEREFIVQVTDSQGVGVPNAQVQLSVRSKVYRKGFYVEGANEQWVVGPNLSCPDEDFNANGQLDANEDFNNSGQLEAGNAVSVFPGEVTTNASGTALFRIVYAQEFGNWLTVTINARAAVQGTAFEESADHALEILASDASLNQSPPGGIISRFGGSDLDATPDATDPLLGDPKLIELGLLNGRALGCRTLN